MSGFLVCPTLLRTYDRECHVLHFAGEFDLATRDFLRSACAGLAAEPRTILNLNRVRIIDAGSLRILDRGAHAVAVEGGRVVFVTAGGPVRRVLEVSGFVREHPVVGSHEVAVATARGELPALPRERRGERRTVPTLWWSLSTPGGPVALLMPS